MTRKYPRKYRLEIYLSADKDKQEFLRKLYRADIIGTFNFLYFSGLCQITDREKSIVENIVASENFELMLDLSIRLSDTVHSLQALQKHFAKLSTTDTTGERE